MASERLKVYDLYKRGKGIFQHLDEFAELPLLNELFDPENIDLTFITLYGDRELSKPIHNIVGDEVTEEDLQTIAKMIYGMYFNKWKNLEDIYAERLDLDTYRNKVTEDITDDKESKQNVKQDGTDEQTHQTQGYNADDWENESRDKMTNDNETDQKGTENNKRERTTETTGNKDNRIDDRQKAISSLRQEVLYDIIYVDVIELVGVLMF